MAAYENDYSTPAVQAAYLEAFDRCLAIDYNARQGPNWIEEFLAWASPECVTGSLISKCGAELNCNTNSDGYFDAGQAEFERCVNDWYGEVTVTSQPRFYPLTNNAEGFDSIQFPITFVRASMYSEKLWTTMDFVHLIDDMRAVLGDIESEYGLRLFPQGTVFEYWEQYRYVLSSKPFNPHSQIPIHTLQSPSTHFNPHRNLWNFLIQNLLIALSCTFVIGTIAIFIAMTNSGGSDSYLMSLLKSMQGSFVMTIAIASTMTWVLGFMGT